MAQPGGCRARTQSRLWLQRSLLCPQFCYFMSIPCLCLYNLFKMRYFLTRIFKGRVWGTAEATHCFTDKILLKADELQGCAMTKLYNQQGIYRHPTRINTTQWNLSESFKTKLQRKYPYWGIIVINISYILRVFFRKIHIRTLYKHR